MFRKFSFPLLLGGCIVLLEMFLALIIWKNAPVGTHWLGDTMYNASDVAVYLSYLRQGAEGHILLQNLFAIEPHAARFDLVWSSLGIVARSGISLILLHEIARWIFTLLLAVAVYGAARFTLPTERDARIASVLAFCGVGTGWLYSIWLGSQGLWAPTTYAAPDVVTEFSIAPTLLGGAHIILSMALLLACVRFTWISFQKNSTKDVIIASMSAAILFLFHPYFIPLIGLLVFISLLFFRALPWRTLFRSSVIFLVSLVPAAFVYIPLASDPVFRTHHLIVNVLSLAPWPAWILTLLPFAAALLWRWKSRIALRSEEQWLIAWIVVSILSMLLPFPWKRKMTEGLGVALVFLTAPAWIALWNILKLRAFGMMRGLLIGSLFFAAALTPFHMLISNLTWISQPKTQSWFYQSDDLFAAWNFLRTHSAQSSIIISDDKWTNVWTPAFADRTVWVAHDHETPDFANKLATWKQLLATDDPDLAHNILAEARVTHFLTTTEASREHFAKLLGPTWRPVFSRGNITVFGHIDLLRNVALLPKRR